MLEHLFIYNADFRPWTAQHVIPVTLFVALGVFFIRWGKRQNTPAKWRYPFYASLLLPLSILWWMGMRWVRSEFDIQDDIPLHMCNLITFFLPLIFYSEKKAIFGILYFWVMAGTVQAIVTPGLEQGPPHFWYYRYWLVHCGLVVFVLYGVVVLEYRPRWKDIGRAFIAMNVLFVIAHSFNLIFQTNYLYTLRKPEQGSLLDFLGPWPWYLLVSEFVAVVLFLVYYAPFLYLRYKTERSSY